MPSAGELCREEKRTKETPESAASYGAELHTEDLEPWNQVGLPEAFREVGNNAIGTVARESKN